MLTFLLIKKNKVPICGIENVAELICLILEYKKTRHCLSTCCSGGGSFHDR